MKIIMKKDDFQLIKETLSGDKVSLNALINKHYAYTFNLCLKMLYSHQDAEDVNQEIWIKAITNLAKFKKKSIFTTWLYRISVNHILSMKKKSIELAISKGFDGYSENLDSIASQELNTEEKIVLAAVPMKKFHMLSFIAIHPLHQHHGFGHYLLAAVNTILEEHSDSEGVAVYATTEKYKQFFTEVDYEFVQELSVGNVSGSLMIHYRKKS